MNTNRLSTPLNDYEYSQPNNGQQPQCQFENINCCRQPQNSNITGYNSNECSYCNQNLVGTNHCNTNIQAHANPNLGSRNCSYESIYNANINTNRFNSSCNAGISVNTQNCVNSNQFNSSNCSYTPCNNVQMYPSYQTYNQRNVQMAPSTFQNPNNYQTNLSYNTSNSQMNSSNYQSQNNVQSPSYSTYNPSNLQNNQSICQNQNNGQINPTNLPEQNAANCDTPQYQINSNQNNQYYTKVNAQQSQMHQNSSNPPAQNDNSIQQEGNDIESNLQPDDKLHAANDADSPMRTKKKSFKEKFNDKIGKPFNKKIGQPFKEKVGRPMKEKVGKPIAKGFKKLFHIH